jgi:hypothetical protein
MFLIIRKSNHSFISVQMQGVKNALKCKGINMPPLKKILARTLMPCIKLEFQGYMTLVLGHREPWEVDSSHGCSGTEHNQNKSIVITSI